MSLPYPDPSNPALPSPLFSDLAAVRADHMRANNAAIFADLEALDDRNPALVALTTGSFKTAALANANTYNGRSAFSCTAGVSDMPSAAAWHVVGIWNPTDSSGRFIAMLDGSLETWEINYAASTWGTWTKRADSYENQFANAFIGKYAATATAGGTLALTVASAMNQMLTGSANHTVTLPDVSTLQQGRLFIIANASTGNITVNSSGGNLVAVIPPSTVQQFLCILTTGTDAASWYVITAGYIPKTPYLAARALTPGDNVTIDWSAYSKASCLLNRSTTVFTFTAPALPTTLLLVLTQDDNGGRSVTFPTAVKWANGAVALSPGANAVDIVNIYWDGSTYYGTILNAFAALS